MAETLARMRQLVGSSDLWATHDIELADGEIAIEIPDESTGQALMKVGSGGRTFSELPYIGNAGADGAVALALKYATPTGSSWIGFLQELAGAVTRDVLAKLRDVAVTPADFGAVGDDTADDTTALKNVLLATVRCRTARLERGKRYLIASDELVMQDFSTLDLNGATLHFTVPGMKRNLAVGNGCVVEGRGGLITNTIGTPGLDGTYQTPVVVGKGGTLTEGKAGWVIRNLRIQSVTPGGNGIGILGDSNNGIVDNIDFGDSSTLAIGIMTHWSMDETLGSPYTGITKHPHNIKISNISAGTFSYNGGTWRSLVFLSSSYNIEVSNVYAKLMVHAKGVTIYPGDWGFQFGTTVERVMGLCGLVIRNVTGQYLVAVHVYGLNPLEVVQKVWPGAISIDNVCAYGITGDSASKGLTLEGCDGVKVTGGAFDSFYNAVLLGGVITNVTFDSAQFRQSVQNGVESSGVAAGSGAVAFLGCRFIGSNTSATASRADVNLQNLTGVLLRDCKFSSSNATWNVRAENTVTRLRAIDNHTYFVSAAGPAWSLGASGDTAICVEFQGNTSDAAPTNGLRSGQIFIPAVLSFKSGGTGDKNVIAQAGAMPDRGTWAKGSVVFNDTPVVGNPIGWVRMTTGSANVLNTDWRAFTNLA